MEPWQRDSQFKKFLNYLPFLLLFCIAAFLLSKAPEVNTDLILKRILLPLLRLLGIMAISLVLSALVEGMGWSGIVAKASRPLMRIGHFGSWSALAFTTAFLSGIAANILLWNAYKEGKIDKKQMYITTLLNLGLPSYVLHLPTTLAITLPLIGRAGLIYVTVTLSAALIRTAVVLAAGRLLLPAQNNGDFADEGLVSQAKSAQLNDAKRQGKESRSVKIKRLVKRYLKQRLPRIVMYTVPIYAIVVALGQMDFFDWLQDKASHLISFDLLPVEGISVVVFTIMAEFTAGATAAGAMLQQGILGIKDTVLALIIGNLVATPVRALRHQLPRYLGIFSPATGTAILVMGQSLRMISVMIAGTIYYIFF